SRLHRPPNRPAHTLLQLLIRGPFKIAVRLNVLHIRLRVATQTVIPTGVAGCFSCAVVWRASHGAEGPWQGRCVSASPSFLVRSSTGTLQNPRPRLHHLPKR